MAIVIKIFFVMLITYLKAGVLFYIGFIIFGLSRVDRIAQNSGLLFKMILFPGVCFLWPVLFLKWIKGDSRLYVAYDDDDD